MFKGSVRSNLDPFGIASDNELWHALGEWLRLRLGGCNACSLQLDGGVQHALLVRTCIPLDMRMTQNTIAARYSYLQLWCT
jgi:hypothetical protein